MKINEAFYLFPGQGAQFPEMGLDFLNEKLPKIKRLFSIASDFFGRSMAELLQNSCPEELKKTDISQPAITLVNLAATAYLKEKGITPMGCAGFSLGEYSALAASGVIKEEDCLFLVTMRGKAMQEAIDRIPPSPSSPGMAAVIGLPPEKVEALIFEWVNAGFSGLNAANFNSYKQVVVSGSAEALEEAEKRFKKAGARRFSRLKVAGPYHSPFMKEAAEKFSQYLDKIEFKDPRIPVFSNVSGGQIHSGKEAKALAHRHILEGVRWTDEEAAIEALKPKLLLETGPGKVLQGLWKDTKSTIPCYPAGKVIEINNLEEK